ncbi:MAG TPA: hypothetical protein VM143_02120 [Acidimicrobiales bacterium]|nr:hypothetical protein [Acidimicrobiales bacterium]
MSTLDAGFGTATITPPTPVRLAGFAEIQDATEVHDDLTARALVLQSDQGTLCLVVCDLMGMSPEFANPARAAVASALGLDESAVLLASTHTHAAPSTMAGTEALGWHVPEGYGDTLSQGCASAAVTAREGARAAELRYGRWSLPEGLSINRRGYPYDPWFSVLDVVEEGGGARIGTLANLAIHPVALGPECLAVSADWVHPFREALQERSGGTAMLLSGALGDVNPRHVHRQGNDCRRDGFEEAAELGAEVAEVVDGALGSTEGLADRGVRVIADRNVEVPIGGTNLARGRRGDTMRVELIEWGIGPVRLVSIPGEAFQAFGRQVEDARGGDKVLLAGLSPLWQGYFPVPFADGYEEGVSYGPEAVQAVLDALVDVPPGPLYR